MAEVPDALASTNLDFLGDRCDSSNGSGSDAEDITNGDASCRPSLLVNGEDMISLQELLDSQMSTVQQVIAENHLQASRLVSLYEDAFEIKDDEVAQLSAENNQLREQLGLSRLDAGGLPPTAAESTRLTTQAARKKTSLAVEKAAGNSFGSSSGAQAVPEAPSTTKVSVPSEGIPMLPGAVDNAQGHEQSEDAGAIPQKAFAINKEENGVEIIDAGDSSQVRLTDTSQVLSVVPQPVMNTFVIKDRKSKASFHPTVSTVSGDWRHRKTDRSRHPKMSRGHPLRTGSCATHIEKGKFEVLNCWKGERKTVAKVSGNPTGQDGTDKDGTSSHPPRNNSLFRHALSRSRACDNPAADHSGTSSKPKARNSFSKHFIINPNSPRRGFWDVLSLVLVLYDMVYIPLQFFEPPTVTFTQSMTWTTRIFWTVDIPSSMITGYVTNDGFIVMKGKLILKRYVRSWLLLDLLIVASDWLELVLSTNKSLGFARLGKASRTIRIIRMLRLLRLARMREVIALISERIYSEKVVIVADILKIVVIIVSVAHFIACIWYGIGVDGSNGWVDQSRFTRKSLGSRYAMSLHWSIAQFAGGMDEVTPTNIGERTFAICMFIIAFIMASVFVSSITSSMTQLNIIGSHQSQHLSILRRYLHQNGISNKLAMRTARNAQYAVSEQQRMLPEASVKYLGMVSEPLRVEIHLEMYAPVFIIHPFFQDYLKECPQVMRKVCHSATSMMNLSAGDVIFSAGEIPAHPKMYFVVQGTLEYDHLNGEQVPMHVGSWISEASLWCSWRHRGVFAALSDCRLCTLDAKKFQSIANQFEHNDFDPKMYATDYVNKLNEKEIPSDVDNHALTSEVVRSSLKDTRSVPVSSSFWLRTPFAQQYLWFKKKQNEKRIKANLKRCITPMVDHVILE